MSSESRTDSKGRSVRAARAEGFTDPRAGSWLPSAIYVLNPLVHPPGQAKSVSHRRFAQGAQTTSVTTSALGPTNFIGGKVPDPKLGYEIHG